MRKTAQLRKILTGDDLDFVLEAHNGISAKIVQEAGFGAIWASSLTLSASLGLRDNNEASWTQILEILEFMSDATTIPILLDGDTGYGNFNNMRRLVKKLEQRQIAGVCIEDKLFPKTNSFIHGERQPLADIDEFAGKIAAGKDAQGDDEFCIVARVEAFIAGRGLKEALRRAEAYRQAGADAVLIHSKKRSPEDIELFMQEWGNRHPVVIVPTTYYSTPTQRFRELGISTILWANHMLRGSVSAMQEIAVEIHRRQSLTTVEDRIATVSELFRLQGAEELEAAEKIYLPTTNKRVTAIVLAASRGDDLHALTEDMPKALLPIHGRPILSRMVATFRKIGISNISVVRGYRKESFSDQDLTYVDNDLFDQSLDLYSLYLARDALSGDVLIAYGDCLYRKHLLVDVLDNKADIRIVVDASVRDDTEKEMDLVTCSIPFTPAWFMEQVHLTSATNVDAQSAMGEWTGLIAANEPGTTLVRHTLEEMNERRDIKKLSLTHLLEELIRVTRVAVVYTNGGWLDVDALSDIVRAEGF